MGVRRFPTLPYAHKPGVAAYLNDWARDFAADVPESLWSATFFPEPEAAAYVDALVGDGVEIFKVHVQVGEFHLDDPLLDPVWGTLAEAGHAGRDPRRRRPGRQRLHRPGAAARGCWRGIRGWRRSSRTWVRRSARSSSRSPRPTSGCAWTPRWCSPTSGPRPTPTTCCRGWSICSDKVLLGTDFPTIPYPYAHQLESLARLDLGDDWLRAVCWENGDEVVRSDP